MSKASDDGSESLDSQDSESEAELDDGEASLDEGEADQLEQERIRKLKGKRRREDEDEGEEEQDQIEGSEDGSGSTSSSAEPENAPKRFRLSNDSDAEASDLDAVEEGLEEGDVEVEVSDEYEERPGLDPDRFPEPSAGALSPLLLPRPGTRDARTGPAYLGPAAAKPLHQTHLEAAAKEPVEDELASD